MTIRCSVVAAIASLGLIINAAQARGPGGVGAHGGDAVVCTPNTGKPPTVEIFDYFEASQTMTLDIDLGAPQLPFLDKVRLVLERLKPIDPVMYERYLKRANQFVEEAAFISRSSIPEISDSHEVIVIPGKVDHCVKVQFAVQITEPKRFQKRYLVDGALWQQADDTTKAGLILHEIIYRDHLYAPVPDAKGEVQVVATSLGTRYYNAVLSSRQFIDFTVRDYMGLIAGASDLDKRLGKGLKETWFGYYDGYWSASDTNRADYTVQIDGAVYRVLGHSPTFWPNGQLKSGYIYGPSAGLGGPTPDSPVNEGPLPLEVGPATFKFLRVIEYDDKGRVTAGIVYPGTPYPEAGHTFTLNGGEVTFDEHGNLVRHPGYGLGQFVQMGANQIPPAKGQIFYPNGRLKQTVVLGSPLTLVLKAATFSFGSDTCDTGIELAFHDNGELQSLHCKRHFSSGWISPAVSAGGLTLVGIGPMSFYENGNLRSTTAQVIGGDFLQQGKPYVSTYSEYSPFYFINLSDSGELVYACTSGISGKLTLANGKKIKLPASGADYLWQVSYLPGGGIAGASKVPRKDAACGGWL